MEHTYSELKKKTVAQLREIAATIEHEALQGHTQFTKDQLIQALCTALGIEARKKHVVAGVDKSKIKAHIRSLKVERDAALGTHDRKQLKIFRRKIRGLKRTLRKARV